MCDEDREPKIIRVDWTVPKYYVDVEIDLQGPQGNAFSVMGAVSSALKQISRAMKINDDSIEEYQAKATRGNYEHLLKVSAQYVHIKDTSGLYKFVYDGDEKYD